jgi:NADPH-dependent stearoyl-CoA 9-desaturase
MISSTLSPEQIESFGHALDTIREREFADLGEVDARYIRRIVRAQRVLILLARALIFAGIAFPSAWIAGVLALALAKILDNMEIGHNVLHGQYDFMRDPALHSQRFEWDISCPAAHWRHTHNFVHHTHANILGKDKDIGYGLLRICEDQAWEPRNRFNVLNAIALAILFEWGVAAHYLELDRGLHDRTYYQKITAEVAVVWKKTRSQLLKDYLLFPLLAGPFFLTVLAANLVANLIRNLWAFAIIFCGHFPSEVPMFREEDTLRETRGAWYLRQVSGAANIAGGRMFHILSGNLGHQIEHHLFPDLPAHRYARLAVEVHALCLQYGVPYHTGSFPHQLGSVAIRIFRMGKRPTSRA